MDNINEKLKEEVEKLEKTILEKGVKTENLDTLNKITNIQKNISKINHYEKEEEEMRYRGYGRYNEGNMSGYGESSMGNYNESSMGNYGRRSRDSRGRYMARGYDAKYRGDEMLNEMHEHYGEYSESREQYGRGNYGAKEDTMQSLEYMLQSMVDFVEMLKKDANSQEELNLIKKYTKEISEM